MRRTKWMRAPLVVGVLGVLLATCAAESPDQQEKTKPAVPSAIDSGGDPPSSAPTGRDGPATGDVRLIDEAPELHAALERLSQVDAVEFTVAGGWTQIFPGIGIEKAAPIDMERPVATGMVAGPVSYTTIGMGAARDDLLGAFYGSRPAMDLSTGMSYRIWDDGTRAVFDSENVEHFMPDPLGLLEALRSPDDLLGELEVEGDLTVESGVGFGQFLEATGQGMDAAARTLAATHFYRLPVDPNALASVVDLSGSFHAAIDELAAEGRIGTAERFNVSGLFDGTIYRVETVVLFELGTEPAMPPIRNHPEDRTTAATAFRKPIRVE